MATLTIDVNSTTIHVLDVNDRIQIISIYPSNLSPRQVLSWALDLLQIRPEIIQALPNTNSHFTYRITFN